MWGDKQIRLRKSVIFLEKFKSGKGENPGGFSKPWIVVGRAAQTVEDVVDSFSPLPAGRAVPLEDGQRIRIRNW